MIVKDSVAVLAHRYMMTALATCFADHHFEFEWIAVADLVDLDHLGLRHYRFVCRASCRLDLNLCRSNLGVTQMSLVSDRLRGLWVLDDLPSGELAIEYLRSKTKRSVT